MRTALVVGIFAACALFAYQQNGLHGENVHGVKDKFHDWTEPQNRYLKSDIFVRNGLIIASSAIMDVLIIITFYRFARYSYTFRLILTMALFYSTRALC